MKQEEDDMWNLKSGEVVIDRPNSHLHDEVREMISHALERIESDGREFFKETVEFDRVIGHTICVKTDTRDVIVFAKRVKRHGYSRFVKDREPDPTNAMTVVLKKGTEANTYILITAFCGKDSEPEPWDRGATPNSLPFWQNHALVYGHAEIMPQTETRQRIW